MSQTFSAALARATFEAPVPGSKPHWRGNDENVVRRAAQIGSHMTELDHIVASIRISQDATAIRVLMKTYLIAWVTLSDVVAALMNEVFDLGYSNRDVSLHRILSNRHVRNTTTHAVFDRHERRLQLERFKKLRNDVVHRGLLDDSELAQLEKDEIGHQLQAAVDADASDRMALTAAVVAALNHPDWIGRVKEFTARRADEYSEHLRHTEDMLEELDTVLARNLSAA